LFPVDPLLLFVACMKEKLKNVPNLHKMKKHHLNIIKKKINSLMDKIKCVLNCGNSPCPMPFHYLLNLSAYCDLLRKENKL
jgi:hypothetical protein